MIVGILWMNPIVNEGLSSMYFFIWKIRHLQILLLQPIPPEWVLGQLWWPEDACLRSPAESCALKSPQPMPWQDNDRRAHPFLGDWLGGGVCFLGQVTLAWRLPTDRPNFLSTVLQPEIFPPSLLSFFSPFLLPFLPLLYSSLHFFSSSQGLALWPCLVIWQLTQSWVPSSFFLHRHFL